MVGCATCGTALKESYKNLVEGESQDLQERVKTFGARVMDVAEFLTQKIQLTPGEKKAVQRVTYHDPCHLNRSQGISSQPRKILKGLPGVSLVEMRDPGRCCGGGGSFSFYNYDLSRQISRRKVEDIEGTGASTVVTGCPGCMLQLKDQLGQKDSPVEVKHLIQVVDEAGG